ncbi:hypothetical protein [Actinoplanes siamensis]|uniref:hypothetical protein n=1 Tax=Actinoplanes siamensis TaxID=1223317 RepID=UPI001941819E|nr:hypothetical protein [Actinoplanes siamensis]
MTTEPAVRVVAPSTTTASPTPTRKAPARPKPTATPKPTASRYRATPAEIYAAEVAVKKAQYDLDYLRYNGGGGPTTDEQVAVLTYEVDRKKQDLADLKAGTPGIRHHKLDIREARVYLALAQARFEWALNDPSYTDLDRDQLYAIILQWTERLQELQ